MNQPIEVIGGSEPQAQNVKDGDGAEKARAAEHGLLEVVTRPRLGLAIIFAIGVLLFVVNLGGYPMYTKGEPREAVTVFDIVHGGGVILPMRAGVEIPSKPLLMHWIAALVSILAGRVNEWTVRIPSALFAIAGMAACYRYTSILFDRRAGFFAAIILGTSFQYLQAGTGCRVDMTLTFFVEIALFEFIAIAEGLSNRTALLYLAIAAAVLTKGPIGAALPVMVAALWIALWSRWDLLARLRLARGALIVGIIGGGWYLAAIAAGGMDFVRKQILAENLYRLFHHGGFYEGHAHPFYYVEGALLAGFMPWPPVAIAAGVQYLRGSRRVDSRFGYLLVWFLAILIFYNLPQSKRGVYLLALYPALSAIVAILMGDAIDSREGITGWIKWLSRGSGAIFIAAATGAFAGLAMLHWWTAPLSSIFAGFDIHAAGLIPELGANADHFPILAIVLPAVTAAIGVYLIRTRPLAEKLVAGIMGAMVCVALAVNLIVEPGIADTVATKDFAARTIALAKGGTIGYFGSLDYGFAFYNGRNIDFVSPRDPRIPALIVSPQDDWNLLGPDTRSRFEVILRSPPTNLDGTSPLLLLRRIDSPPAAAEPKRLSL